MTASNKLERRKDEIPVWRTIEPGQRHFASEIKSKGGVTCMHHFQEQQYQNQKDARSTINSANKGRTYVSVSPAVKEVNVT